ncbi:hypothetical protein SEVIR_3G165400v4 [Setaria viridis]|uniref:Uncharacterized protein n=2 Tax=Setaria TaxID=4554 RepID=K3ZB43_SETIT|nr:uncharacterized protein At1g15400 [Setaria italica]XP_034584965.1 uncharacterized protein At1g15400-like [Setaria viridis]RCV16737.1 hypothetical protein SETIT_3G162200v2 [Setaria italica]TKW26117.1 hypothetical protein SEVIR_3G165400v2 [Setaria viridis]
MAGLQRSSETFRRSGSSGLVWDDKNFSGEIKPAGDDAEPRAAVERSRSAGHAHGHGGYRTTGRVPPALDPPSPRVGVCGFCRLFGGSGGGKAKPKGRRH